MQCGKTTLARSISGDAPGYFIWDLEDRDGDRYRLSYVRDKDGREVDFAVEKEGGTGGRPEALIEVKWSDREIARPLV